MRFGYFGIDAVILYDTAVSWKSYCHLKVAGNITSMCRDKSRAQTNFPLPLLSSSNIKSTMAYPNGCECKPHFYRTHLTMLTIVHAGANSPGNARKLPDLGVNSKHLDRQDLSPDL